MKSRSRRRSRKQGFSRKRSSLKRSHRLRSTKNRKSKKKRSFTRRSSPTSLLTDSESFHPVLIVKKNDFDLPSSSSISSRMCPWMSSLDHLGKKIQKLKGNISRHTSKLEEAENKIRMFKQKPDMTEEELDEVEDDLQSRLEEFTSTLDLYKYVHFSKRKREK